VPLSACGREQYQTIRMTGNEKVKLRKTLEVNWVIRFEFSGAGVGQEIFMAKMRNLEIALNT